MEFPVKISVIIPVYNAGNYLQDCLLSVCDQSYKNLEIICVNDGSTDNSLALLESIAAGDNRIIIINSGNEGVSAARNKGLQKASGDYISFVDADDWIDKDMIGELYFSIIKYNTDLSVCNVTMNEGKNETIRLSLKVESVTSNPAETIPEMLKFKFDYANWNKLYKAGIIRNNHISFNDSVKVWEDLLFNLMYIQFTSSYSTISAPLYHYRVHTSSVMGAGTFCKISEYNNFYSAYKLFAYPHRKDEFAIVQTWMADNFYNNLLPSVAGSISKANRSVFNFSKDLAKELDTVNDGILVYSLKGNALVQKIKKKLLMRRQFFAFSFLTALAYKFKGR